MISMKPRKWNFVKSYKFDAMPLRFFDDFYRPERGGWDHIVEFKAVVDGDKHIIKIYSRDLFLKF